MKKFGIFALVLALTMALSACGRTDTNMTTDTTATTGNTMPTVITTMPSEENVPGTSFQPDQDGLIDGTDGTDGTEGSTGGTDTTGPESRMRLR